jgi:dTDP-4-amino-4,6-dideoxy-D-galactose acyltransferase
VPDESGLWTPLPWDTEFFGVPVGRIERSRLLEKEMTAIIDECRQAGIRVLYFLSASDDDTSVGTAEHSGFRMVDVRITFEWKVTPLAPAPVSPLVIRGHRGSDLDILRAIARKTFGDSRYYHDRQFPRERCDALYEEWITRDCDGRAERVLVAESPAGVAGFLTCHLPSGKDVGRIGLVGVAEGARGGGVGRVLTRAAQEWFADAGARRVVVVTQARNAAAQRLYQRAGFVTRDTEIWFHKWFE